MDIKIKEHISNVECDSLPDDMDEREDDNNSEDPLLEPPAVEVKQEFVGEFEDRDLM